MDVNITPKFRRFFIKGSNTSVAAASRETVLEESFGGLVNVLTMALNFDDTTGTTTSKIIVTVDNVEMINETLSSLRTYFAASNTASGAVNSKVQVPKYDNTVKEFNFIISLETFVKSGIKIEVDNTDPTNAVVVYTGLIVDK